MKTKLIQPMLAAVLSLTAMAASTAEAAPPGAADPGIRPYVGDWVGEGWGWEVRFRQSQREFVQQFPGVRNLPAGPNTEKTIMALTVRHVTHYHFKVDETGAVKGEGEITYDLFPNLCGVATLTKQVNEQVNMMAKLPTIFKMATEIGVRSAERFNGEFYAEESKLAAKVTDIVEKVKAYEKAGGPVQGYDSVSKVATSLFLKKDQPKDVAALVTATVWGKCLDPTQRIVGSHNTCLDLLVRPIEKSVQSFSETAFNASLKLVFDMLKDTTKSKLKNLDLTEQQEVAACSGTGNALAGGTRVGPATAGQLATEMAGSGVKAGMEMATGSFPHSFLLSIPGVTQVQYYYKGLSNGPETRDIKLKGRLEPVAGGAKLYLEMDGDVSGGDKRLFVEYTVNYRKDVRPFPTWSPFLQKPGDARTSGIERIYRRVDTKKPTQYTDPVTGKTKTVFIPESHTEVVDLLRGSPFAASHETGDHRNGVKPWLEYEYFWNASKVMEPKSR
ncbi:MAG: hypothetical protein ABSE56_15135 [Bryobacteraceae bacterium]|jgi:hypothetical protein